MQLTTEIHGQTKVVTVDDARIDAASAIQFKDEMRQLRDAADERLVLNLSQVDFVDSSGLGAIVAVMKMMDHGQKFELAEPQPAVEKVFRLTRMDNVMTIHASLNDALGEQSHAH